MIVEIKTLADEFSAGDEDHHQWVGTDYRVVEGVTAVRLLTDPHDPQGGPVLLINGEEPDDPDKLFHLSPTDVVRVMTDDGDVINEVTVRNPSDWTPAVEDLFELTEAGREYTGQAELDQADMHDHGWDDEESAGGFDPEKWLRDLTATGSGNEAHLQFCVPPEDYASTRQQARDREEADWYDSPLTALVLYTRHDALAEEHATAVSWLAEEHATAVSLGVSERRLAEIARVVRAEASHPWGSLILPHIGGATLAETGETGA